MPETLEQLMKIHSFGHTKSARYLLPISYIIAREKAAHAGLPEPPMPPGFNQEPLEGVAAEWGKVVPLGDAPPPPKVDTGNAAVDELMAGVDYDELFD
jgi:hypothetical protein